jgi:hypothetical protein
VLQAMGEVDTKNATPQSKRMISYSKLLLSLHVTFRYFSSVASLHLAHLLVLQTTWKVDTEKADPPRHC